MKKILLILLSTLLLFSLSACSGSDNKKDESAAVEETTTEEVVEEPTTEEEQLDTFQVSDAYFSLELEEYLKLCETYNFPSVIENAKGTEGAKIKYIVKIDTVVYEGDEAPYQYIVRVVDDKEAVNDNLEIAEFIDYETDNLAYMYFPSDGTKIPEGKYCIVYGEIWGEVESNGVTMPRFNIVYVEMN